MPRVRVNCQRRPCSVGGEDRGPGLEGLQILGGREEAGKEWQRRRRTPGKCQCRSQCGDGFNRAERTGAGRAEKRPYCPATGWLSASVAVISVVPWVGVQLGGLRRAERQKGRLYVIVGRLLSLLKHPYLFINRDISSPLPFLKIFLRLRKYKCSTSPSTFQCSINAHCFLPFLFPRKSSVSNSESGWGFWFGDGSW